MTFLALVSFPPSGHLRDYIPRFQISLRGASRVSSHSGVPGAQAWDPAQQGRRVGAQTPCHVLPWGVSSETPCGKAAFCAHPQNSREHSELTKTDIFVCVKKVEIKAFNVFLMQNLEHCQPQHRQNNYDIFGIMPWFGIEMEAGKPDFPKGTGRWLWSALM